MNRAKSMTTKGTANTNQTAMVSSILAQVGAIAANGGPVRRVGRVLQTLYSGDVRGRVEVQCGP
jgi:hypothetical protein